MNKTIGLFLVFVALLSTPKSGGAAVIQRQSDPLIALGAPQHRGSGCPEATMSSALTQNGAALSLLFDNFVVSADAGAPVGRKICEVDIPVQVPSGIKASFIGVDYRGFNSLPAGARADFSVAYTFSGGIPLLFNNTFSGPIVADYFLQNTLSTAHQAWSSCGENTVLRTNKGLVVTTNGAGEIATSSLDSVDMATNEENRALGMTFYFQWQSCTSTPTSNLTIATVTPKPGSGSSLRPALIGLTGLLAFLL